MEVEEARPSARHRMAPIDMYMAKLAPREDITLRIRCSNFSMTSYTQDIKSEIRRLIEIDQKLKHIFKNRRITLS